jgi:Putative Ig domain
LPVTFGASGSCTIAGTTVHITGAGSCTITASQAGDANYNPAPDVARTFSIGTAGQTITFGTLANKTFGDPDFAVSATASSGLPVSFAAAGSCTVAGTTVHITGGGSCTITASQAGDSNYGPAPDVPRTFSIARANQTITFGTLANKTFGDPDFAVSATASSGLSVSFAASGSCTVAGTTVHITGAGSCTITASQAGNANYNPAPDVPQTFTINTKPEVKTLGLNPLPPQTNDTLTATVTPFDADGNPVTLTYVWKNGATVVKTTANTTSLTDTLDLSVAGNGSKGDTITVEVTPNDGVIVGNTRSVSVVIADSAPILTVINQTGSEGTLLTFQLSAATDSDGDTRTYSASDLPLGATFDQATRTFSWTPTAAQGGPNPYLVRFTVSDGTLTDTKVASITIADTIADRDGDGIPDAVDNCPDQYNPDQADVCHNSSGAVTGDATVAPTPPTGPIDVVAIFTFTATAPGTYVVRPNPMNVICRVTDQATQQELKWQTVPEGFPIVLSTTSGDLASLPASPFVTTFNLRDWYPDLAPGSYTVVCTYVNFAHIPAPEADDPIIWMGTVDAPPQTILIGLSYVFGGFDSPADHEPFKRGRTVPVKFDLRDATGAVVANATPRLFVQRLQNGVPVGGRIPATPAGGGTGNTMEFGSGGYHYNMATDPLAPGQWQLQAQLGDGTTQVITIIIR